MLGKLLRSIMKKDDKVASVEVVKIDWVTGKDKSGNHYIRNTKTNEQIYCLSGNTDRENQQEAERLVNYYNKL
jgi:hypothetical protein